MNVTLAEQRLNDKKNLQVSLSPEQWKHVIMLLDITWDNNSENEVISDEIEIQLNLKPRV